jgi:hypothetical protein
VPRVAVGEKWLGVEDPGDPAPVVGVGGDPSDMGGGDRVWSGGRGI